MTQNHEQQGPLSGANVIDFGWYYAGPMAGLLLADQGANVIRIVKPGAREVPEQQYRLLNRNKKLLELDLKTEAGKAQALQLIKKADILIENFRPGVMKRLGLDYATIKPINSGLVYLSLPGFASTDKARANLQAWEGMLAAASGMFVDVSYVRKHMNFPPLYHDIPVNSVMGAAHGAIATMAALLAREKHGQGTSIEVPLVNAGTTGFVHRFWASEIRGTAHPPFMEIRTPDMQKQVQQWGHQKPNWYAAGDTPDTQLTKLFNGMQAYWDPLFRYYECADGRMVKSACMGSALRNSKLLKALDLYATLLSEGFINVPVAELKGKKTDNNIADYPSMSEERQQRLERLMKEAFLTKTSDEWDAIISKILPFAKVRTRAEFLALPEMQKAGVLVTMGDGSSSLVTPGPFVDVANPNGPITTGNTDPISIPASEAERLFAGQNTFPTLDGQTELKKGDLLKGLKILDVGTWVAGPMSAYQLSQYGADVIKLDEPVAPGGPGAIHFGLGKRSILADLKTAQGRKILEHLAKWADVVVHNKIDPVAERLGVTQAQLQKFNPNIIVAQVSACGGPRRGVWEGRFGLDPIGQAVTGLMAHFGSPTKPHDFEGTMIADALAGFGLAYAGLLSVWQRNKTGFAGEAKASLVRAGSYIQLPWMIAEEGKSDWGEARGQSSLGPAWHQRFYECSDGWIYVHAQPEQASLLMVKICGHQEEDHPAQEQALRKKPCAEWVSLLTDNNIPCHRIVGIDDLCNQGTRFVDNDPADETATGSGEVICWENPPSGAPVILQAMDMVRVGEQQSWRRVQPTPLNGTHTREILLELGFDHEEIEHLYALTAIA